VNSGDLTWKDRQKLNSRGFELYPVGQNSQSFVLGYIA
jgi:hypothetical protein